MLAGSGLGTRLLMYVRECRLRNSVMILSNGITIQLPNIYTCVQMRNFTVCTSVTYCTTKCTWACVVVMVTGSTAHRLHHHVEILCNQLYYLPLCVQWDLCMLFLDPHSGSFRAESHVAEGIKFIQVVLATYVGLHQLINYRVQRKSCVICVGVCRSSDLKPSVCHGHCTRWEEITGCHQ